MLKLVDFIADPMQFKNRGVAEKIGSEVSSGKPLPKPRIKAMRERTELPVKDRNISMSNALARGAHALSLAEKRVIAIGLSKTDSVPATELQDAVVGGWWVKINAAEYAETFEIDAATAYEQLKHTAKALLSRKWKTVLTGKRGTKIREGVWCSLIEYWDGEGRCAIKFTAEVAPELLALRKEFMTYKLKQASTLRSIYAWRLFECLQSWKRIGAWSPTIEEFQVAMDAPESCCTDFFNLNKRIIEPAIRELRDKDSMIIDVEFIKSGRKVTDLVFKFHENPQGKLDL